MYNNNNNNLVNSGNIGAENLFEISLKNLNKSFKVLKPILPNKFLLVSLL